MESTSSGSSIDGLSQEEKKAEESFAFYRKLQSSAQQEKPKPKLD